MSKKTPNPLIPIAEVLGQDVGEIKRLLEQNQNTMVAIKRLLQSKGNNKSSGPPESTSIILQGLSDESGIIVLNYNVEPQSSGEAIENYGLPVPDEVTPYRGWIFVKQYDNWRCLADIHLGEPLLIENDDPCEVLIIAQTQSTEKKTVIATEVNT